MLETRKLRVFLCYASEDKHQVFEIYRRLACEVWIEPWLKDENLLPGQNLEFETQNAISSADVIVFCMSSNSVEKEGPLQKELRVASDVAREKPEGIIFLIPVCLDKCKIPNPLLKFQQLDYSEFRAYERLKKSLLVRAQQLNLWNENRSDYSHFIKIDLSPVSKIPYVYWIAKYPVTNSQYERFLYSSDFANELYWRDFLRYDECFEYLGHTGDVALRFLKDLKPSLGTEGIEPKYWRDIRLGEVNRNNPVVGISWYEANAYSRWLSAHWYELDESRENIGLKPHLIRLPLECEWVMAAGGEEDPNRYPWDMGNETTRDINRIKLCANVKENAVEHTSQVNKYSQGASPYGVMDMAGNVWEWQANYWNWKEKDFIALRGGCWDSFRWSARVSSRYFLRMDSRDENKIAGFRLVLIQEKE